MKPYLIKCTTNQVRFFCLLKKGGKKMKKMDYQNVRGTQDYLPAAKVYGGI